LSKETTKVTKFKFPFTTSPQELPHEVADDATTPRPSFSRSSRGNETQTSLRDSIRACVQCPQAFSTRHVYSRSRGVAPLHTISIWLTTRPNLPLSPPSPSSSSAYPEPAHKQN